MQPKKPRTQSIFALPIIIAVLSLIGLIAALLGDALTDAVAWTGLAAPMVAVLWAVITRHRPA